MRDRFGGVAGEKGLDASREAPSAPHHVICNLNWRATHAATHNYAILAFRALMSSLIKQLPYTRYPGSSRIQAQKGRITFAKTRVNVNLHSHFSSCHPHMYHPKHSSASLVLYPFVRRRKKVGLSLEVTICTKDEPRVSSSAWRTDAVDTFSIQFPRNLLYLEAEILGERQHVQISHRRDRSPALQ